MNDYIMLFFLILVLPLSVSLILILSILNKSKFSNYIIVPIVKFVSTITNWYRDKNNFHIRYIIGAFSAYIIWYSLKNNDEFTFEDVIRYMFSFCIVTVFAYSFAMTTGDKNNMEE